MVVGVRKSRAFQVKTQPNWWLEAIFHTTLHCLFTTLACIQIPSFPPLPSFLLSSPFPSFHFSSIEHKPTNIYSSLNIILSSRITVLNQTHSSCLRFYNQAPFVSLLVHPRVPSSYMKLYEHFSPQWSLFYPEFLYWPRGCLPIHAEPSVRKCEDVSWEILDIKSILELDSICLFPSPQPKLLSPTFTL